MIVGFDGPSGFTPLPVPEIRTERLLLRGWRPDDIEMIVAIFGDERTARHIGGVKAPWQAWRHMATLLGHWHLRGYTPFALERLSDGRAVGYAGPWYPDGWPEPEIGYALVAEAHGHGYATEAVAASLGFAYDTLGWTTAISLIHADNDGSKAVAARAGAHFERGERLFGSEPAEVWRHERRRGFDADRTRHGTAVPQTAPPAAKRTCTQAPPSVLDVPIDTCAR